MQLEIKRIILFVRDMHTMGAFYRDVIGLKAKGAQDDPAWMEFEAGASGLALHKGGVAKPARRSPKIVFGAANVPETRRQLIERGASLGTIKAVGEIAFCDGRDPEGNVFQISNRG